MVLLLRCFTEEHNPPHFHAEYQEYDVIININDGLVIGKMPRRALKLIFEWLDLYREELLKNWVLAQERKALIDINPLN